jgi:GNAT superfamily N-acetyltransferase
MEADFGRGASAPLVPLGRLQLGSQTLTIARVDTGNGSARPNTWVGHELVRKSRESHVRRHTPRDSEHRFASADAYELWSRKGRELYALVDGEVAPELAAIIWYGEEAVPQEVYGEMDGRSDLDRALTFAIRIYDGYQGRGAAKIFMEATLIDLLRQYQRRQQDVSAIWLETDADNGPAVASYLAFGYRIERAYQGDAGRDRLFMVLSAPSMAQIATEAPRKGSYYLM